MKNIKNFQTVEQYEAFMASTALVRPNVSLIKETKGIGYNPKLSVKYATITCDSATYNGQTQVASNIIVTYSGTTLVNNTDYTVTGNSGGVNVGSYTFTINGINNYEGTKNGTFIINKVTPTVTAPTAKVLTYNGEAQELVNAGSTNWGTLKYSLDGTNYSTSIPTATNYGSYTVYYKVDGDSNINDVSPATVACSINEKQVTATVELSQDTYTYDGTAKQPTVTVKDGSTVIDPSEYSVAYSNNINAGTATVTISDNVGGNYEVIGSTTFTIEKANPSYVAPTATNPVYNTSAQALLVAGTTSDGTIQYSADGSEWGSSLPQGTNAGIYTSYWKLIGDDNHVDVVSTSISTTIDKVTPTVAAPTPNVLTYNTESQELVVSGSTDYGTMKYSLDNSTWATTVPSAVNYGTYTVYYKVEGDSNIDDVAASSIQVSIAEKRVTVPTIELSQSVYTYDNTAKQPSVTVKDGTTVIPSTEYTVEYSNNINAGTATVTISDNVDGNYYVSGTTTFTIDKVTPTVTAPTAKSLTYNGNVQTLLNAGSTNWGILQYSNDGVNYSTTIPSATNANTYGVYYKVEGDSNINDVPAVGISVTIAKADPAYTAPTAKSLTYNTSAQELLNAGSTSDGTIQYSSNGSSWSGTIPTGTNANTYTSYWKIVGDSNHNDKDSVSISTTIAKADQAAPSVTGATTTYPTTATATANGGGGQGSIEWESAQSQSSVGSHTTRARWTGNSNYNASPWSSNVTVQMNKAAGSVSTAPVNTNYTYNGTARAVASAGSGTGTMYYRLGSSGSFSTTMPTMTNAGSDTLYYYAAASTNYEQSATGSITVTVQKASQNAPTATGATVYCGSTATATASGGGGYGSIEWSNGSTRTAIGSQTTKARWTGNTNYNASPWSNEVTLEVKEETRVVAKYNVTSTTSPTQIISEYSDSPFSAIEIDGVEQSSVVSKYTFSTTGEHTVKYTLTDPTSIGSYAFYKCSSLTSIVIPDTVTIIGYASFSNCSGMTTCTIGSGVTSIDTEVFYNCISLTSINIPSGVTNIGDSAFDATPWWNSYSADTSHHYGNVIYINDIAYMAVSTGITSCNLKASTVNISAYCFKNCKTLTSVDIPDNVISIGQEAFSYCSAMTTCTIGSGVTIVGYSAFIGCSSLMTITSLAATAPTLANTAFRDVKTGGTLYVPNGSSGYDTWMRNTYYYLGLYNWTKVEQ